MILERFWRASRAGPALPKAVAAQRFFLQSFAFGLSEWLFYDEIQPANHSTRLSMAETAMSDFPESIRQTIRALQQGMEFVSTRLINRKEVIRQIFFALLTREHALLQSRTGVGKSLLTGQIFALFPDARIFKVQASKEQQPDTYFGGLNIEQLKSGKMIHNTDGTLVRSEFGFIDEIFDANDFTLRALLSLLNERALIRGVQYEESPLHSVIAATNYLRVNEVTEAVLDRFLYKAVILPDKNPFDQYKIARNYLVHSGNIASAPISISYAALKELTDIVCGGHPSVSVAVPADVAYFQNLVIRYYEYSRNRSSGEPGARAQSSEYYISPRTQAKSLDLLRAVAVMKGRKEAKAEDVQELQYMFTTLGVAEEKKLWTKAYQTVYNTLAVSNGFDQLRVLLSLAELIEQIRSNPAMLQQPLNDYEHSPVKKSLLMWIKDILSKQDSTAERNLEVLKIFLSEFVPVCDEIRELKNILDALFGELVSDYHRGDLK